LAATGCAAAGADELFAEADELFAAADEPAFAGLALAGTTFPFGSVTEPFALVTDPSEFKVPPAAIASCVYLLLVEAAGAEVFLLQPVPRPAPRTKINATQRIRSIARSFEALS
jgi:hypothetical protein